VSLRTALGILACVQLGLAAITWWPAGDAGGPAPLLDVESDAITQIEIESKPLAGEEPSPVVLARSGDGWVVRSAADFPARPEKIEELLGRLLDLEFGTPVALQQESHNALKVGEDEYGRRISVRAGDEETNLVLGAATSKSVNVRLEGEQDVYRSSGVSEWGFSDTASSYYDPLYVSAAPTEITALTVRNGNGVLEFRKEGESFTLADLADGEVVDAAAVDRFVAAVTKLRMTRPVTQQVEDVHGLGDPEAGGARVDWTLEAEDQSVAGGYAIGAVVESDRYAKAVDSQFVVRVLESATTQLRNADRQEFLVEAAETE